MLSLMIYQRTLEHCAVELLNSSELLRKPNKHVSQYTPQEVLTSFVLMIKNSL
jgi:hypothetical protein